jgi:hypothetical protein
MRAGCEWSLGPAWLKTFATTMSALLELQDWLQGVRRDSRRDEARAARPRTVGGVARTLPERPGRRPLSAVQSAPSAPERI